MKNINKKLLVILIIAFTLRLFSCFKYPFGDEIIIIENIIGYIQNKNLVTKVFDYPLFFGYVATVPTLLEIVILKLMNRIDSIGEFSLLLDLNESLPLFAARLTSLFFGLGSIVILYMIGKKTFYGKNWTHCRNVFCRLSISRYIL